MTDIVFAIIILIVVVVFALAVITSSF